MLTYRSFRNTDPPLLAALWRSRAGQRGWLQPVDIDLLEQHIFAKLYFDYAGLLLAFDDEQCLGFAHAAFAPNAEGNALDRSRGVIALVLAKEGGAAADAAAVGLLGACEAYLAQHGAQSVGSGGGMNCEGSPFYLGLYGGAIVPGVLENDTVAQRAFTARGYEAANTTLILERDLARFEAPIDRRQMEVRRRMVVQASDDPPARNWWEACTLGAFDLMRFELMPRGADAPVAWATFRSLEAANAVVGGSSTMGLVEIAVLEGYRRRGLAVFLLSEAMRQFSRQGSPRLEAQAAHDDAALLGLYAKVGFQPVSRATLFRKPTPPEVQ